MSIANPNTTPFAVQPKENISKKAHRKVRAVNEVPYATTHVHRHQCNIGLIPTYSPPISKMDSRGSSNISYCRSIYSSSCFGKHYTSSELPHDRRRLCVWNVSRMLSKVWRGVSDPNSHDGHVESLRHDRQERPENSS